jgi:hypothetical protein
MSTPNTEVRLCSNVPLSNNYQHQRTFSSISEQSNYFLAKVSHVYLEFTYQRDSGSIRVPAEYDLLYDCNYLMFRNNNYSGKWFYAFITDKVYKNPNMTEIHFEIDVWNTWYFDLQIKPSYVVREHVPRWNADGTPRIHMADEGLDYGSEYEVMKIDNYKPYGNVFWLVIVAKEKMDTNQNGEIVPMINGSPQPLSYYVHPFMLDGSTPTVNIQGMNIGLSAVSDVLLNLYKQDGAVGNIVSLYVTEYIGIDFFEMDGVISIPDMNIVEHVTIQDATNTFNTLYVANVNQYEEHIKDLGDKYSGFANVEESKLLMYPYSVTILTDMKGNQQEIRNEYIKSPNLRLGIKGSIGTSNKVSYQVKDYNMTESSIPHSGAVSLENAIINNSPNDVPIITDLLSAYLQGNRNTIENQKNSIAFNGTMNMLGGAFSGIGQALQRNAGGVAETGFGMVSAYGNTNLQLQGLQAKQSDINNVPAQISKMGGNTAFDFGNSIKGVYVVKKQIKYEYRKRLGDYFKMYGYKINELKTPNLRSRQHFNYIQTVGANIVGDVPAPDLEKIRSMFDNGVTLWHGDWVLDYSQTNAEV